MKLYDLDPGADCPEIVRMIVEIPKNSANKYEYDGELGVFRLDRALYSPMHYPGDYGFIPGTLAEDGDPMDVLTLVEEPSFSGCLIAVRPLGMLDMLDQEEPTRRSSRCPTGILDSTSGTRSTRCFHTCCARSSISSRSTKSWKASAPRCVDGKVRARRGK
jgi:Inorganic pyrophosphatase